MDRKPGRPKLDKTVRRKALCVSIHPKVIDTLETYILHKTTSLSAMVEEALIFYFKHKLGIEVIIE